jgi:Site-specific recombinases, DNA invertase Pin homologs
MNHYSIKKAVIYTRTVPNQGDTFYLSREEQSVLCQSYAKEQEMEIVEIYHDDCPSGLEVHRPALTELLQMIATEINMHVLVASVDRLGRDMLVMANVYQTIQLLGAKVVDVSLETRETRKVAS